MNLDLVFRLRQARRLSGLTQEEASRRSGVGVKTISSFESGDRAESIKVRQLRALLRVYGTTEEHFFSDAFAEELMDGVIGAPLGGLSTVLEKLRSLPPEVANGLITIFDVMVERRQKFPTKE